MKYLFTVLFSFCFAVTPLSVTQKNTGDEILGFWWTQDRKAKVEVYKRASEYHGKIVWLNEPLNDAGQPKLDKKNSNEELRQRPVLGLNLISGFKYEKGKWVDGEIYDPENGKTYDCVIKMDDKQLEVRGYIGLTMFGRTVVWERVD
jgi:uncharacterized protein (DUF2147 family)